MSPIQNTEEGRLRASLKSVLECAAELIRPCKRCSAPLYFVRSQRGTVIPFTTDGRNHFTNCPHASEFHRSKRAATQEALIDTAPLPE